MPTEIRRTALSLPEDDEPHDHARARYAEQGPRDRLPATIVVLSNRGDDDDGPIGATLTMRPDLIRTLAESAPHEGFGQRHPTMTCLLNQPFLGGQEVIGSGAVPRELSSESMRGLRPRYAGAEFLRELRLGERNTGRSHERAGRL